MTKLGIYTTLTMTAFASCQTSANKDEKVQPPIFDTPKKTVAKTQVESTIPTTGSFIARLKDSIKVQNAIINDNIIFQVRQGQIFVYENNSHNAWLADGRSAYIPPEQVVQVDTPFFKFNFTEWNFVKNKDYELMNAFQREGVDLNALISKVRQRDKKAFKTFLNLSDIVDGAAAGEYAYDFWALLNLWTDQELSDFVNLLTTDEQHKFSENFLTEAPIEKVVDYYELYYPKTLRLLQAAD